MWSLSDVTGVFPGTITITGTMCICRRPGFLFVVMSVHLFVVSLVCLLFVCKVTGDPTRCCLSMCV